MELKSLVGVAGILITAMATELNDQVTGIAGPDIRGGLGISNDPGTWFTSLYISAEIVGLATSPWLLLTFSLRRFTVFVILLCLVSSVLLPFSPDITALYALRILQGLAGGFAVPLLLTAALRVLTPETRLYGLGIYALTSTLTPALAAPLAALWTEWVGWRFTFFQAVPSCILALACAWFGLPQDKPAYHRFRMLDWRGLILLVAGFGAFSTMLVQGNRLDWFNSPAICMMALASAVLLPLLVVNEWLHPLPFLKLQLLRRRNLAYGLLALFTFTVVSPSGSTIPLQFLQEVQGFRPIQAYSLTVVIALAQLVMLPAMAVVLNYRHVDARVVHILGLMLVIFACVGASFVTPLWKVDQFYVWQAMQAIGQPMVVVSLLVLSTNTIRTPDEAPFASALVNTPRGIAEATGAWLLDLVTRWRGGLHYNRLADQVGQDRGLTGIPGGPAAVSGAVQAQATVLTLSDTYLVLAAIAAALIVVSLVLTERTLPPRLALAKK